MCPQQDQVPKIAGRNAQVLRDPVELGMSHVAKFAHFAAVLEPVGESSNPHIPTGRGRPLRHHCTSIKNIDPRLPPQLLKALRLIKGERISKPEGARILAVFESGRARSAWESGL
jgi:hypothetical protein